MMRLRSASDVRKVKIVDLNVLLYDFIRVR